MKRLRRMMIAAAASAAAVTIAGTAFAVTTPGTQTPHTLSLPGETELLRLDPAAMTFQISHDGGREWSRPVPQSTQLHLRSRSFDPLKTTARPARGEQTAHIVQFFGAPLDSQRRDLAKLGVRLDAYLPDYAYVARMSAETINAVKALPYVRWVGTYDPEDKVAPGVGPGRVVVTLVRRDVSDQSAVIKRIESAGGAVHSASAGRHLIEATLDSAQLAAVATFAEVLAVDAWAVPENDMNLARIDGGANAIEAAGYRGNGVRGEVIDGGLLTTHQEFKARPPVMVSANTSEIGHGTATYGQVFASGVSSSERGLLPQGQGLFASYHKVSDRHAHAAALVNPFGPLRAVFQSNSWGSGLTTSYTSVSALMDDIVFDHDLLICQSQSNTGTTSSRPEAWAKNVVSVGGQRHRNTLSRTDDSWSGSASIGPAKDGRIKPDLSNYNDAIATTSSESNTAYTTSFGGTSGATPITCGNFGLLFEMWADGVFSGGPGQQRDVFTSRPHAATAKAMMINTAHQYSFFGTTHDLTRTHQGWGTASVGALYNEASLNSWTLPILVNETDLLRAGQRRSYTIASDGSKPLKATLAWTDPAGSPSASKARVNDLTLKVTAPNGTVYWGNNGLAAGNWSTPGGLPNSTDTVENVFIPAPATGNWTIEVSADTVNADGHVETSATDVDFALVVTGRSGLTAINPGTRDSTQGVAISPLGHQVQGGTLPLTWSATGLPPGLSINSVTGVVTGTPTSVGEFTVTVTVTDSTNPALASSITYRWNVNPDACGFPIITSALMSIPDPGSAQSSFGLGGCTGNASATATIELGISHPTPSDLVIDLIAPDGSVYNLHNRGTTLPSTHTRNLSSETRNGVWQLRVNDVAAPNVGFLSFWVLTLGSS